MAVVESNKLNVNKEHPDIAGSTLGSTQELREHLNSLYFDACADFEEKSFSKLASVLGGKDLVSNGKVFKAGLNRSADSIIVSSVIDALLESRPGPVEVLEVAAGLTYGKNCNFWQDSHYGSPWLSRKLKAAFGDKVNITVSDFEPDPLALTVPDKDNRHTNTIVFFHVNEAGMVYFLASTVTAERSWKLPDFPLDRVVTRNDLAGMPSEMKAAAREALYALKASWDEGRIFIRPVMDYRIEQAVFGLESKCGVNYLKLSESFPSKTFDVVFGRHLNPLPNDSGKLRDKLEAFENSLRGVLTKKGKGILHFHDDKKKTDIIHQVAG